MRIRLPLLSLLIAGSVATVSISKNVVLNASNVTIVSIDSTRLLVSRTTKGRTEALLFVLRPDTVRKGALIVGAKVTVHYMTENGQNIATSIQSREPSTTPRDAKLPQ